MSSRPTLAAIPRARDLAPANAKPGPKPDPIPDPDEEDVAARDRMPPLPAGSGHYPPAAGVRRPPASVVSFAHQEPASYSTRATPRAERMISFTMRLPLGLMERVERACAAHGLDKSAFGRDAFSSHLDSAPFGLQPTPLENSSA